MVDSASKMINDKCGGILAGGVDLESGNDYGSLQYSGGNISAAMAIAKATVSSLKNEFSLLILKKKNTEEITAAPLAAGVVIISDETVY